MGIGKRDIGVLSFKLLGVYSCIRALELSSRAVQYFYEGDARGYLWIALQVLLPPVSLILLGVLLWISARIISRFVFPSIDSPEPSESSNAVSYKELQDIAFSVCGLVVLVDELPMLVRLIVAIFAFKAYSISAIEPVVERNVYLFFTALRVCIGMWLLLGSRGIVKAINAWRRE